MTFYTQFSGYLNQLYCAESHLVERLSEICTHPDFEDSRSLIDNFYQNAEGRCSVLESIYALTDLDYSFMCCKDLIGFMENAFDNILNTRDNIIERNLALLYYLNITNAVAVSSLKSIELLMTGLNDDRIINLLNIYQSENKTDLHLSLLCEQIRSHQGLVSVKTT
ncbi:hypothetical protein FPZ42_08105 [Mucilaginibacter achroorhodeus]|uniref:DUF892 family protein n=1 Tax=Mucilaginibacter achroorhodeus TaxID=2599294 RepID=A0A563U6L7_9SPHI|nr:hypothetical protein [Mucilaginibacter achroorhodeus]QXV64839.1 hypothetical protein INP83_17385 [Mucilaginibacter sp. 21P]TWR26988.1 hypothetical protein FPZ42_08105 [Mucilaginibacter achroorhodeus]